MPELKPCPFCGGKAYSKANIVDMGTLEFSVICNECGVKRKEKFKLLDTNFNDISVIIEKSVSAWNTRIIPIKRARGKKRNIADNSKIKAKIYAEGLQMCQIATEIGMSNSAFSRKLRYELIPEEVNKILDAIAKLKTID